MKVHDKQVIEDYEKEDAWKNKTLLDQVRETAEMYPEREAIVDPPNVDALIGRDQERLTYEELDRIIDAVATYLQELGVERDDAVVVQLPNTWELAMLYLAISRAGAYTSPLPIQWRRREFEHVLDLCKPSALITVSEFDGFEHADLGKELANDFDTLDDVVTLNEIRSATEQTPDLAGLNAVDVGPNDVFNLQWTSGTTADPKACPMTHNQWFSGPINGLTNEDDRVLEVAPLVNMTALGAMYVPCLEARGTLVLHHPLDVELLIDQLIEEKVNYTTLVPAVLNRILKHPDANNFDLSHVDSITTGSAAPSEWSLEEFKDRWGVDIICMWGQNEGTEDIAYPSITPDDLQSKNAFPLFGGDRDWDIDDPRVDAIEMRLVDPESGEKISEVGEVGELIYDGPMVIPEYFQQPELTAEAFDDDGFFYTGDLFVLDEYDFVRFFDRKKDVIMRGGFTISAKEIENIALEHPDIVDSAAVAMPDPDLGEKTCLYAVLQEDADLDLEEVTSFMEEKVAVYKRPERLEIVDEIPRNPVGKVLKTDLRERIEQEVGTVE